MKWGKINILIILLMLLVGCNDLSTEESINLTNETQHNLEIVVDSEREALSVIVEYLKNNGQYIPAYVDVESENDTTYIVQTYDLVIDPITRSKTPLIIARYEINKKTAAVSAKK